MGCGLRSLRIHSCRDDPTLCSAPLLSLVLRHCPQLTQLCVLGESSQRDVSEDVGAEPSSMQAYAEQRRARLQIDFSNEAGSASGAPTTFRRISLGSPEGPSSIVALLQSCATEERMSTVSELHLSGVSVPDASDSEVSACLSALVNLHTVSGLVGPSLPSALAFLSALPEWRTLNLRFHSPFQACALDLSWLSFDAIAESARCLISSATITVESNESRRSAFSECPLLDRQRS